MYAGILLSGCRFSLYKLFFRKFDYTCNSAVCNNKFHLKPSFLQAAVVTWWDTLSGMHLVNLCVVKTHTHRNLLFSTWMENALTNVLYMSIAFIILFLSITCVIEVLALLAAHLLYLNRGPFSCVQPDFTACTTCPHKQSLYVLHLWVTWACWGYKVLERSIIVTQLGSLITLLWTPEKSRAFI